MASNRPMSPRKKSGAVGTKRMKKPMSPRKKDNKIKVRLSTTEKLPWEAQESIDHKMGHLADGQTASSNLKMAYEVKHLLTDAIGFPVDLVTDEYVQLFLKNRAKNHHRHKYTIRGSEEGMEAQQIKNEATPDDPIGLIRMLTEAYRPLCTDLIDNLDIYTLPSFNLSNLDKMFADALNLDELGDGLMDGVGAMSMLGGGDDDDNIEEYDVVAVFKKWDKNGNNTLCKEEFFGSMKELSKNGIDLDLDCDGDINEEVDALFDLLDVDDDQVVTYEEWHGFVHKYRDADSRDVLEAYVVFEWHYLFGPFVFVFVYILYAMSVITQFLIPIMITNSYMNAELGEDGANYLADCTFDADGENGHCAFSAWCPNKSKGSIKLSGMMLYLFLLVATPVADLVASIYEGGKDEDYYLIRHSRFCEDTFFKETAPVINLLCFATILITTYLLFMSAPEVDQLLLNVIAVNFLIEVDNICITTVIDQKVRDRMIAKMVMWYIAEGEKKEEDMNKVDFYWVKLFVGLIFGNVAGWAGILIYMISWFLPFVVYGCL